MHGAYSSIHVVGSWPAADTPSLQNRMKSPKYKLLQYDVFISALRAGDKLRSVRVNTPSNTARVVHTSCELAHHMVLEDGGGFRASLTYVG